MKIQHIIFLALTLFFANSVMAVPFSFQAGDPAVASQVNANFSDVESQITTSSDTLQSQITENAGNITTIEQRVSDNESAIGQLQSQPGLVVFDYRNYGMNSVVTQKVFSSERSDCGATEIRNYLNNQVGENTEMTVTRLRYDAFAPDEICQRRVFNYLNTPTERQMLSRENWNNPGTILSWTDVLSRPLVLTTSSMIQGNVFGSGVAVTRTFPAAPPESAGAVIQTNVVLGVENVSMTVNNQSAIFQNCLVINVSRDSDNFGGSFNRISWHCPSVGEIKRIEGKLGSTTTYVLTGITPPLAQIP